METENGIEITRDGEKSNGELIFNRHRWEKFWEVNSDTAARHCKCSCVIVNAHIKMVKIVNFTLCIFYNKNYLKN